jgi:hypothetical protein
MRGGLKIILRVVKYQTLFLTTLQSPATPDMKVAATKAGLTPAMERKSVDNHGDKKN